MNVNVSEKVESRLKELASRSGQSAENYAGVLLEEIIAEKTKTSGNGEQSDNGSAAYEEEEYENPFAPFVGMFASGKTDTSKRYKEILREEIDNRGGFGGS